MYQLIFFDLDGTLYDLDDVIESVYQNQVVFLSNYLKKPRSEIQKMFSKNHDQLSFAQCPAVDMRGLVPCLKGVSQINLNRWQTKIISKTDCISDANLIQ